MYNMRILASDKPSEKVKQEIQPTYISPVKPAVSAALNHNQQIHLSEDCLNKS
jgi:hypothetical protein